MTAPPLDDDEKAEQKADDGMPTFPKWMWRALGYAFAVFVVWGLYMWRLGEDIDGAGQWADSFGPLTGGASALALLFVVWSSHMQRKELDLTRNEMRAQRLEMEAQRKAQEDSAREQKRANDLAKAANELAREQLAARSIATQAQREANHLSRVACEVEIARGVFEAYRFAGEKATQVNIGTVDGIADGRIKPGQSKGLNKAADHIVELRVLRRRAMRSIEDVDADADAADEDEARERS